MASRLYAWLDSRLNLKPIQRTLLDGPIPGGASWIYVFGSATLFLFTWQAATGMFLAIHVLFLPAILIGGIALHLFILRRVGPAGPWTDDRASLNSETFALRQVYMDAVVIAGVFLVVATSAFAIPLPLTDRPDPSEVGDTRPDRAWHLKYFRNPQAVLLGSFMPKFPLTDQQLNDLTSYMLSLKRAT